MSLIRPYLAKCENRALKAKVNIKAGEPSDWFMPSSLKPYGFSGIDFDFFVNWKTEEVSNEIWIKRLLKPNKSFNNNKEKVVQALMESEELSFLTTLSDFADKYAFKCKFCIIPEVDWNPEVSGVLFAELAKGVFNQDNIHIYGHKIISTEIIRLTGGSFDIGRKGLTYGTSPLECLLAKNSNGALWPGDADLILLQDNEPFALVEFKKHTKAGGIETQRFSDFYPKPDKFKNKRLAILREYLKEISGKPLPFIYLFYSTNAQESKVKLEEILGRSNDLRGGQNCLINMPAKNNANEIQTFLKDFIQFVKTIETSKNNK